jgi:hypothetical protein
MAVRGVGIVALMLGAGAGIATAVQDHRTPRGHVARRSGDAAVSTTAAGTVVARQVDRRGGLVFEVETSTRFGSSGLYVRLMPRAPAATREALFTIRWRRHAPCPVSASANSPGGGIGAFVSSGTALLTDDPSVVVANVATRCALWLGAHGAYSDEACFGGPPFSRVRLR